MKIVSLVPSYTKLLCDIGLKQSLVGVTNFCVDPVDLHRSAERIGGTKDPDLESILSLKPDVVFVNSEENRAQDIATLKQHLTLHESCPKTVDQAIDLIADVHQFLDLECSYDIDSYRMKLSRIRKRNITRQSVLYFIWKNPYMVASKDTYIDSVLELAGYINRAPTGARYPTLSISDIKRLKVEKILLSNEPYPFRKRDCRELDLELGGQQNYYKADGKLFSWHASHTLEVIDLIFEERSILIDM